VVLTAHGPEEVAAAPVAKVVDTTGAGDLFAGPAVRTHARHGPHRKRASRR
jgi:sugar/nucleoside kinase (ribokinase family)